MKKGIQTAVSQLFSFIDRHMKKLFIAFSVIVYVLLLTMCCIMFKESYDYKPRLPLINNYTISLNVDKDSMLNMQSSEKLDSLKCLLQKSKKEEYAEGINDVRQETNNIINKINGWLSFWLAILALIGGVLPVIIGWKQEQDNTKKFEDLKNDFANTKKIIKDDIKEKLDEISNFKDELCKLRDKIEDEYDKQLNRNKIHETHINITNIISSFIAAKDNKLLADSYERDYLRVSLLNELSNEFNKITECMFKDEYLSESKIILKTILIQFYSLYASLRVTLLKAYKVKELEETLNKIKLAIKTVTEDKCSKDEIEKVVKEVKNEIEKSNSLFYNNK